MLTEVWVLALKMEDSHRTVNLYKLEKASLELLAGTQICAILDFWPTALWDTEFIVLSHYVCGNLLQ